MDKKDIAFIYAVAKKTIRDGLDEKKALELILEKVSPYLVQQELPSHPQ